MSRPFLLRRHPSGWILSRLFCGHLEGFSEGERLSVLLATGFLFCLYRDIVRGGLVEGRNFWYTYSEDLRSKDV